MSGGHFDYANDRACNEMFDWLGAYYGLGKGDYHDNVKAARKLNPCRDKMLSEMVYDMFCLLHSLDWYLSGDTGEEDYLEDAAYFKSKWLGTPVQDIVNREIDKACEEVKEDMKNTVLWRLGVSDGKSV